MMVQLVAIVSWSYNTGKKKSYYIEAVRIKQFICKFKLWPEDEKYSFPQVLVSAPNSTQTAD